MSHFSIGAKQPIPWQHWQEAKKLGAKYSLAICNVPESSLVRESDLVLMTRAGPEMVLHQQKHSLHNWQH